MRASLVSESLRVREDGTFRLAAVADTHSRPHRDAAKHLAALKPDAILHAGDVGDEGVLEQLRTIAPVFAVKGNIDAPGLPEQLILELTGPAGALLRILVLHIGVAGPRLRADAARIAHAQHASLVVCGHSHVPFIGQENGVTVFNPGSIGPRRFTLPIVFGVIELGPSRVTLRHINCETGDPWRP